MVKLQSTWILGVISAVVAESLWDVVRLAVPSAQALQYAVNTVVCRSKRLMVICAALIRLTELDLGLNFSPSLGFMPA